MSTAVKNTIIETFRSMKEQLNVCAALIDECIQQGTIK